MRVALLMAALALGCSRSGQPAPWLSPSAAPEIEAVGARSGEPIRLSAQRGRVVVLSFGYTACADACPMTLAKVGDVLARLGADAAKVKAFYVSVDPARDTPGQLREFLQPFDPRIEGLSVASEALPPVLRAYGVAVEKRPPNLRRYVGRKEDPSRDYSMEHSAGLWVVDPRGQLRIHYPGDATAEEIAAGVRRLLD